MHSRPKRRALRITLAVVATAATVAGLSVTGISSAEAAGRVTFAGSVPSWAKSANVVTPDTTPASTVLQGEIFFDLATPSSGTWSGQTAEQAAKAISSPGNPQYRHYLTPAQWISTFAPGVNGTAVTNMRSYLTTHGVQANTIQVPTSGLYIVFRGTQAEITGAFNNKLASYNVNGTTIVAPSTAPSLPSDVAAGVSGIVLDQSRFLTRPESLTQAEAAKKAAATLQSAVTLLAPQKVTVKTPCSTYTNQVMVKVPTAYNNSKVGTANCGYSPAQLRAAYKVTAGTTAGAGQTVAIVDAYDAPTTAADVNTESRAQGSPTLQPNQYQDISTAESTWTDQAACDQPSGWQGEQALDVEAVHAIAPAANILYAGASDCGAGTDLALSRILDGNAVSGQPAGATPLATIISNSYGDNGEPSTATALDANLVQGEVDIELQAAAEGVGLYYASGDNGDERSTIGTAEPDFPASSPWVTAVGGTSIGLSKTNTKIFETGWGDLADQIVPGEHATIRYEQTLPGTLWGGGAGGGKSALFKRGSTDAWYQTSPVVPGSLGAGRRLVPDVAALADPYTGMLVGIRPIYNNSTLASSSYTTEVSGGTSLATPIFAAQMAIAQQQTTAQIGFANPALYSLAATTPASFVDVVTRPVPAAMAYSDGVNSYLITLGKDTSLTTAKGYDTVTGLGEFNLSDAALLATPAPVG